MQLVSSMNSYVVWSSWYVVWTHSYELICWLIWQYHWMDCSWKNICEKMFVCLFISFLVAINNLPAKYVPITRKGLLSLIMSDGEMPYCCSENGLVWNLFHFKHFLIPLFAFCCSLWFWYDLDFFPDSSHFSLWLSIHGSPVSLIGDFHS